MLIDSFESKYCPRGPVRLMFAHYGNGNNAIRVFRNGEQQLVASVNPPEGYPPLAADEIAIKDWSENEGVIEALKVAGVIAGDPVRWIPSGYVIISIYNLTDAAMKHVRKVPA